MTASPAERTLAAECRAVEAGHQARLAGDGRHFLVKSDSRPGVDRSVEVVVIAGVVVFRCDCDHGQAHGAVTVPCKHGATAARRLERERLLRWEAGRWTATPKAETLGTRPADDLDLDELADLLERLQ
jgi:hypothetical protein